MWTKTLNFDLKSWLIFVLGGLLLISILFKKSNKIDNHKEEIDKLHKENVVLLKKVDSLKTVNTKLDLLIKNIDSKLSENNNRINNSILILNELKKKKNEIPNHVNSLSADGTAAALSEYLENRTKSNDNTQH